MTMRSCEAIRQPDVVTLLHREFGSLLSWRDFLADCIRRGASIKGLTLTPVSYEDGRPLYDTRQVDCFIQELRSRVVPKPIEYLNILVDDSVPWIPPRVRRTVVLGPVAAP